MAGEQEGQNTEGQGPYTEGQSAVFPPSTLEHDRIEIGDNGSNHGDESPRERHWFPKNIKPAEWIMIAFTAVTALAAWAGVYVANGQLNAMNAAAPDTAKIVQANQDLAIAAKTQAINTGKLVDAANRSANAAHDSAVAASGQLHEMHVEQRPIIKITTVLVSAPLRFADGRAYLSVAFRVRNIGRTVAIAAAPHAEFYIRTDQAVVKRADTACQKPVQNPVGNYPQGFNVFPDGPQDIGIQEIASNWIMNQADVSTWKASHISPTGRSAIPMLVGCLDYIFDGRHHHTSFIYEIDKSEGSAPSAIDPSAGDVPANQVSIQVPPWFVPDVN